MTADEGKRRQLGRGLSALFGEESEDYAELDRLRLSKTVPVEFIQPGKFQPRHRFDEEEIRGLVDSIRANGILQPILVRRLPDQPDRFEIIAGERRWRAAQVAKLHEVPVIVKDLSDGDALEIALVENLQRQDLTPLEEAEAYRRLMEEFSHTQEDLARALGKSRSHIANTMRLLALPEPVRALLDEGKLTAGHGRALLVAQDPVHLAQQVVARGLNVRQTEALAQEKRHTPRPAAAAAAKDADTAALEKEISNLLGLKVTINHHAGGGTVTIRYQTLEQLDDVLRRLSQPTAGRGGARHAASAAAQASPASAVAKPASGPTSSPTGKDPGSREPTASLRVVVGGTYAGPSAAAHAAKAELAAVPPVSEVKAPAKPAPSADKETVDLSIEALDAELAAEEEAAGAQPEDAVSEDSISENGASEGESAEHVVAPAESEGAEPEDSPQAS